MKYVKHVMLLLAILFMASGCSMTKFDKTVTRVDSITGDKYIEEDPMVTLAKKQFESEEKCYDAKRAEQDKYREMMNNGNLSEVGLLSLKHSEDMKILSVTTIAAITGKKVGECSGTNVFDALIAEVQSKNKAVEKGVDGVVTLGKWGVGAWALDKVTDNVFSKAGNTNNFNNDGDASADNSSPWEYNWHNQRDTISTNGGSTGTDDFTFEPTDLEVPVE